MNIETSVTSTKNKDDLSNPMKVSSHHDRHKHRSSSKRRCAPATNTPKRTKSTTSRLLSSVSPKRRTATAAAAAAKSSSSRRSASLSPKPRTSSTTTKPRSSTTSIKGRGVGGRTSPKHRRGGVGRSASGFGTNVIDLLTSSSHHSTTSSSSKTSSSTAAIGKGKNSKKMTIDCSEQQNEQSKEMIIEKIHMIIEQRNIIQIDFTNLLSNTNSIMMDDIKEIAIELRYLFGDPRPWECITFVDEIIVMDWNILETFIQQRKQLLKILNKILTNMLIPVQYHIKIHIPDNSTTNDDIFLLYYILKKMKKDKTITSLTILTSSKISTNLLNQSDDRAWDDFQMNISGRIVGVF